MSTIHFNDYTLITHYINGQLNDSELAAFEVRLASDSEFKETVEFVEIEMFVDGDLQGGDFTKVKNQMIIDSGYMDKVVSSIEINEAIKQLNKNDKFKEKINKIKKEYSEGEISEDEDNPGINENIAFVKNNIEQLNNDKKTIYLTEGERFFGNVMEDIHDNYVKGNNIKTIFLKKKSYSIAASISVLLLIGSLLLMLLKTSEISPDEVYLSYYQQYEVGNYRASNSASVLSSAIQTYKDGNYDEAYELFQDFNEKNNEVKLLEGITQIETSRYEEAIKSFSSILKTEDITLFEHAKWYLGLCYLKIGDVQKAIAQFEELAEIDGSIYNDRVNEIIERLD